MRAICFHSCGVIIYFFQTAFQRVPNQASISSLDAYTHENDQNFTLFEGIDSLQVRKLIRNDTNYNSWIIKLKYIFRCVD
jgi:hypothetical protein